MAEAREWALAKAERDLEPVLRGLGGRHYKTQKQVDVRVATLLRGPVHGLLVVTTGTRAGKPILHWHLDREAMARAALTDGVYALATNVPGQLSPSAPLHTCKDQFLVERRHCDAKHTLGVPPIFLHNDDRFEALISLVGLALLIFGLIEALCGQGSAPANFSRGYSPKTAVPYPRAAPSWRPFRDSA